jgi:acetyltransferase
VSIRNLKAALAPESIAVVGAGLTPTSLGHIVLNNIRAAGFAGPLYPVNPHHSEIGGLAAFPDAAALPQAPDLAVIATPADAVADVVGSLATRGCRAAVVLAAGFGEGGAADGARRREAVLAAARPSLFRIIGPNCFGVISPSSGLNASFSRTTARRGQLAVVSQSGAVTAAMIDWAGARGIGFSHIVSVGDMIDVDFGDLLDYLAGDAETHAILLYVEAVTHARKFMSAARAAARLKPVLVVKAGRAAGGAKVAASHTGALAGADAIYDAAFARAGVLRVEDIDDLFASAEILAHAPPVRGDRLAIVTNGGGFGVLATDLLLAAGGHLAELAPQTLSQLNAALPPSWSKGNPVDIIGDADAARYAAATRAVLNDPGTDAVLAMYCPTAVSDPASAASAVIDEAKGVRRPVLTAWLGEETVAASRTVLARAGIPAFATPSAAIRGFMDMVRFQKLRTSLMEVPAAEADLPPASIEAARALIAPCKGWMPAIAAREVLGLYGIPCNRAAFAATAAEAGSIARDWNVPVALKISSPDIIHKSDVGGVMLNVPAAGAAEAAGRLLATAATRQPAARLDGVIVEEMVVRAGGVELILGITVDPTFGPVIVFGRGGTGVEVINDKAFGLPPLNPTLARAMIASTRVGKILAGYRDRPAADIDAIVRAVVGLSQLAIDHPQLVDLDINPLIADHAGAVASDARIKINPGAASALVVCPYPRALTRSLVLRGGGKIFVRAIRPQDEASVRAFSDHLSASDIRARYFASNSREAAAARLTQIDYNREIVLIATAGPDRDEILAVAQFHADPDNVAAEFAIGVRSDRQCQGIGFALLQYLLKVAKDRGLQTIWGDVLSDNTRMLALCAALGMRAAAGADPTIIHVATSL